MMKRKWKRFMAGILAAVIVLTVCPQMKSRTVHAASVGYDRVYVNGSYNIGGKTKSGNWFKWELNNSTGFCMTLGGKCSRGATYEVNGGQATYTNTSTGDDLLMGKIIYWYDTKQEGSKSAWVIAQGLFWSVKEGATGRTALTNIIQEIKANNGYFPSKSAEQLYSDIFETADAFSATVQLWKKSGASRGWQELMTVDSVPTTSPVTEHSYQDTLKFRQKVKIKKVDEDGNALAGASFTLSVENDDLSSFIVTDQNGTSLETAVDDGGYEIDAVTDANGEILFTLMYECSSSKYYYITWTDSAGTEHQGNDGLDDDTLAQVKGRFDKKEWHYASDMTSGSGKGLAYEELESKVKAIPSNYILTETATGNGNLIAGAEYAAGQGFTVNSSQNVYYLKSSDMGGTEGWEDDLGLKTDDQGNPLDMTYLVGTVTNKYKKVTVVGRKKAGNTVDGKAYGDATLAGAVYMLYSDAACTQPATVYTGENGTYTKTCTGYTTDENGKLDTDYLRCGVTYYAKEVTPPEGFLLSDEVIPISVDGTPYPVEWTPDAVTFQAEEPEIFNTLSIVKYCRDESNTGDSPTGLLIGEKGAVFQVYLESAGSYEAADDRYERDTIVCNGEGVATTKRLAYGTYKVHQTKCGDGLDTELAGDFSMMISEDIQSRPKGYTEVAFNEDFTSYLRVTKVDKQTGKSVLKAGTVYQIYKVDDKGKETLVTQSYSNGKDIVSVSEYLTDESGQIMTYKPLKSGTYRVYERDSAPGLRIETKYIEITLNSKNDDCKIYTDEQGITYQITEGTYINTETKGRMTLAKTGEVLAGFDKEKNKFLYEDRTLDGAVFEIYADGDILTQDAQGTKWFEDGELVATVTSGTGAEFTRDIHDVTGYETGGDGKVTVTLPLGAYSVREVYAPYGYALPEKAEWKVNFTWNNSWDEYVINSTEATDKEGILNVWNERAKAEVGIVKTDEQNKAPVSGAVFGVYTQDDIYNADGERIVKAGTQIGEITTGEDGTAKTTPDLPLMSEGYEKGDSVSGGAVTAETEKERKINSGRYYLKELSVSDSYYLDETEIPVNAEYKDSGTSVIKVEAKAENLATEAEVDKLTLAGSVELAGCSMKVTDSEGNEILSWVSGEKDSISISDKLKVLGYVNFRAEMNEKGNLMIRGLLHDKAYVLAESRPADGYVTAREICFQLVKKQYLISAASSGADALKAERLFPVCGDDGFRLLRAGQNQMALAAPAGDGRKLLQAEVPSAETASVETQTVTVAEIKNSPDGSFTSLDDNVVRMYDDTTKIDLSKTSITGSKEIEGCQLIITRKTDGSMVEEWISGKEPHRIEGKLAVGETYTLTEKRPADGYATAADIDFVIQDTGEVQKVWMKDDTTKIQFHKTASDTKKLLPGAEYNVYDKKGKKVYSFKTKAKRAVMIEGKLAAGETYTFREKKAPENYEKAADIKITVKDTGKVQKLKVVDKRKAGKIVTKTPDDFSEGGDAISPKTGYMVLVMLLTVLMAVSGTAAYRIWRRKKVHETIHS
ncbi:MAG: SpaA isopeptide-forming pilin-related protein [Roseburia sp.]|nr:SpaA isopeptide-forming pilin-related protein [Roseburia sp.]